MLVTELRVRNRLDNAAIGELLVFENGSYRMSAKLRIRNDVGIIILGILPTFVKDAIRHCRWDHGVPVGEALIGRVVDRWVGQ